MKRDAFTSKQASYLTGCTSHQLRYWDKVKTENEGLYHTSMTTGIIVPYWDILQKISSGDFIKSYDSLAKASYLWNASDSIFISWETPKEIEQKVSYIKKNRLGGAMFWEYSLDQNQELLNTLSITLNNF